MLLLIDIEGPAPKRGDLVQTNVGDRRERTCLVLAARAARNTPGRYRVWCERWWQLDEDFRWQLYRSAERAGGQNVITFRRYPAKKRVRTFEQFMSREMI